MERTRGRWQCPKVWEDYEAQVKANLAEIFERLSARWPQRFRVDNFADTPLAIIHQSQQMDLRLRAEATEGVAEVACAIYRAHGVKAAQPEMFNPAAATLYRIEAKETVPPKSAYIFLALAEAGKLPSWVASVVDMKLIKAASSGRA